LSTLRVVTYNVHGCVGADGRFVLARIARVIRDAGCDVVLLQEVGDHVGRAPTVNQAHALAAACEMDYVVGYTLPIGPWGYGNVVMTRGTVAGVTRIDLSVPGREPRGCLRVEIAVGSLRLTVVAVHLGLDRGERGRQVAQLLGVGGPVDSVAGPLVVGGDFNDWPPGRTRLALRRGLVDAAFSRLNLRGTFPARFPIFRLDRLYSRRGLSIVGYEVLRTPLTRIASDHLPVLAEYRAQ
jgi:endonuclease/exonuclease/phosphatase family metal-dependent hydrolase